MFTGLIEEIGTVASIRKDIGSLYLTINCKSVLDSIKIGNSIAVNGACQTVTEFNSSGFTVFASCETLNVTTFNTFVQGSKVNLERTLRLCDRLDGHIVSGHVDGIADIVSIQKKGETTIFSFELSKNLSKQVVKKGSITIDGISLTVSEITDNIVSVAVIPHTLNSTNLKYLKIKDKVNIETDIISKYVEKYLSSNDNSSNIDIDFLKRNGFT